MSIKKAILDGVHDALVQAIKIPDYDRFQRLYELDEANFETPKTKTDNVTLVEITIFKEDLLKLTKIIDFRALEISDFNAPNMFEGSKNSMNF